MRTVLFALAVAVTVSGGCVASGQATMGVDTTAVVYQDPPPPRVETYDARAGFVFVKGRWNWQNGNWVWVAGHWERERSGYAWSDGRWERRGNRWEWIEGSWTVSSSGPPPVAQGGVTVTSGNPGGGEWHSTSTTTETHSESQGGVTVTSTSTYPTGAPPPIRVENSGTRAGFVWVGGRWDWQRGQWAWVDGHWERERANQVWVTGRWELQGNRWTWIEGRWEARAAAPVVRDHRH